MIDITKIDLDEHEIKSDSIKRFFENVELDIKFEDPYFHLEITYLFDHFKHEYSQSETDIIEELKASYEYETNQKMNPAIYEKLMKEDNIIEKLYSILEPKRPVKRNIAVYINDEFGTAYTGAKQSYIEISKLQNWVDEFHEYTFENETDKLLVGFILYLLYVRIHPHTDGNGRMGRYLFLENRLMKPNLCPLSKILNEDLEIPNEHMNDIFTWLNTTIDPETNDKDDYYKMFIPNKILYKIYYIIYISICYKYCCSLCKDFKNTIKRTKNFLYLFCICKGFHEVGTSTVIRIDERIKNNNQKFVKWIDDNFLDWNKHVEIIKSLLSYC